MACNLPSFSVHGLLQAGILEWVAICFSWRYSWPRDWSKVSCIAGRFFTIWATGEEGGDNLLVTGSNDPNALFLILMNAPKILTINLPSLNNTSMVPHHHSIYTLLKKAYWEMDILIIFEQQILIFPRMIFIQWKTTLMLRDLGSVSRSVQSLSCIPLFATPWIAARQASLSITNSWSSLKLTSIELVMPSSHLILCHPFLLLPPIPPSIRVFSNESNLCMRWPKYWSFSFSIILSKEHPGLSSFRMD